MLVAISINLVSANVFVIFALFFSTYGVQTEGFCSVA